MALGLLLTLYMGKGTLNPVPANIAQAIQSVEVTNSDSGRDGFQIVLAAGRAARPQYDYHILKDPLLKVFNQVSVMITFGAGPPVGLINGMITNQQLSATQDPGKSTLTLTGEDRSVMMTMKEKVQSFPHQAHDSVASQTLGSYAQLGLQPNVTNLSSPNTPSQSDWTPTHRGHDFSLVQKLAKANAYVFYLEPTRSPGVDKASWRPRNLMELQPPLSVNLGPVTNVSSINFQYDALKPQLVGGSTADRTTDKTGSTQTSGSSLTPLSQQPALTNQPHVRQTLLDSGGLSAGEAKTRAQATTDNSAIATVTASGELDALAYGGILRSRKLVEVRGCGETFDGKYYVKSVNHSIKPGQYTQKFTLTREGLGSLSRKVANQ